MVDPACENCTAKIGDPCEIDGNCSKQEDWHWEHRNDLPLD